MRNQVYPLIIILLILAYSTSCERQGTGPGKQPAPLPVDETTDSAGFLDGSNGKLYVRASQKDSVLQTLGAEQVSDSTYTINLPEGPFQFTVLLTDQPYLYTPDGFGHYYDTIPVVPMIKIHFNARCNWLHAGFVAPCMLTFGPHARFGGAMEWAVNNWNSCAKGDSVCIEFLKKVGTITYYPGPTCIDSIFVTRNILRFRCD